MISNFSLLSSDMSLWDPSTKATWGSLDFYPAVMHFQVCTITQRQLTALSQVGAWGDAEKPQQDMAFVLIAPSLAIRCKWVFGLTAMWTHPHLVHLPILVEAAQKLMLLADEGTNWPYAYARMNDTMAHTHLFSEGHIGIMTSGLPSMNTCSLLDQLWVWRLLQCGCWLVCPDGLNESLRPLLFGFKELPLWNAASAYEPTQDPPMIDVDLSDVESKTPPSTRAENPLGLNLREHWSSYGGLPQLPCTLPHNTSLPGHNCHQWP